jgi:bHLH factor
MDSLLQFDGITDRLSEMSYTDPNNNSDASPIKDKYSLRPRSMRRATEQATELSRTDPATRQNKPHKQKQKPAPLSKYRRKTANARERNRMREINQAFETLRRVIPHMQAPQVAGANEKLTKITTLRLAMKYISALSAALNGSGSEHLFDTGNVGLQ